MRIELPWPDKHLNPNNRAHWRVKAQHKRAQRELAYWITITTGVMRQPRPGPGALELALTFYPPDCRPRDLDNCLASCKSLVDGIADALGVNDRMFSYRLKRGDTRKRGAVLVEIGVTP